jgi:hypothetical protein
MKKPEPRTEFTSKEDELDHILECVCWLQAEGMSLDLGMPQEYCADVLKQGVLEGRYIIDFDRIGDRVRLIPAPSLATH